MTPEQVARHEAAHACAAILLGIPVKLVDTVGDEKTLGYVRHAAERITDRDMAYKRMLVVLAGPLMSCEDLDETPSWPLQTHRSTDERTLSALVDYLGLDEGGYNAVVLAALELTLTGEFRRLHTAITGCLDYVPRIGPELLDELQTIARDHR